MFTALGGGASSPDPLERLADPGALAQAKRWGLAIRLGQRLSGGVAAPLRRSHLAIVDDALWLNLDPDDEAFYGESVERRHRTLADAFGLQAILGI
jgi:exopolyphosphatase/guanosine-5'-triphosphate,3'-diphosphate pyrophosphatase